MPRYTIILPGSAEAESPVRALFQFIDKVARIGLDNLTYVVTDENERSVAIRGDGLFLDDVSPDDDDIDLDEYIDELDEEPASDEEIDEVLSDVTSKVEERLDETEEALNRAMELGRDIL